MRTEGAWGVQGKCSGAPDAFADAVEPLTPITPGQCVIIATTSVFRLPAVAHRVWLDSLYLHLDAPPAAAAGGGGRLQQVATGVAMDRAGTKTGAGVSLWMTNVTVQGVAGRASRGLLVAHPKASVHVEGAGSSRHACVQPGIGAHRAECIDPACICRAEGGVLSAPASRAFG